MKNIGFVLTWHFIGTWILYLLIYLITSWTMWEFKHPFQWLIDLPTYHPGERFMILVGLIFYQMFSIAVWKGVFDGNHWWESTPYPKEQTDLEDDD